MDTLPHGFRRSSASDLLVPEAHSRQREVWTKDERKLFERAMALLDRRNIRVQFACADCREPITKHLKVSGDGVLRCSHKERLLTQAF